MNLYEIMQKLRKKDNGDIKTFSFIQYGSSYGANGKKPARVSIQMPIDMCNENNRNLGELRNWKMFIVAIPREKWKEVIEEEE